MSWRLNFDHHSTTPRQNPACGSRQRIFVPFKNFKSCEFFRKLCSSCRRFTYSDGMGPGPQCVPGHTVSMEPQVKQYAAANTCCIHRIYNVLQSYRKSTSPKKCTKTIPVGMHFHKKKQNHTQSRHFPHTHQIARNSHNQFYCTKCSTANVERTRILWP